MGSSYLASLSALPSFSLVALLLGLDGSAVARLGEDDRLDPYGGAGGAQRVVGARALQLHGAADVAGRELRDLDAVLARHGEELRELLLVARARIDQLHAFGDAAADHAEVGYFADVLFELALEYERHGRLLGVGGHLLALDGEELRSLQRPGGHVDDELHESLGADVALAAGAEDGQHIAVRKADFQSVADVVLREGALLEVELHERFVVLGGRFDQLLVEGLGAFELRSRNLQLLAVAVVVLEAVHLHEQHVDESVESGALIDGILHDDGFHARSGADRVERGLE